MPVEEAFWSSWFGVSVTGLGIVALLVAATVIHRLTRGIHNSLHRWLIAISAGVGIASVMTPADILSTLILSAAFLAFFAFGANSRPASI